MELIEKIVLIKNHYGNQSNRVSDKAVALKKGLEIWLTTSKVKDKKLIDKKRGEVSKEYDELIETANEYFNKYSECCEIIDKFSDEIYEQLKEDLVDL